MTEELISFETAKLAKDKEFDVDCNFYYTEEGEKYQWMGMKADGIKEKDCYAAYSQSLLQKWLREEHSIDIFVIPQFDKGKCNYDSFLKIGYTYETTKGDCIHLMYNSFSNHIKRDWLEDQKEEGSEYENNFNDFQKRIGKIIFETYEQALEKGLQRALKSIE